MIRFAHPIYLYALLLLPLMVAAYWLIARRRRRALQEFGTLGTVRRLAEDAGPWKRLVKFSLLLGALFLLIVGLANPQIGTRLEEVKQEGVDIFVALDVSLSMKSEDLKPSRLDKAKLEIRNLIQRLRGDRIGLIVFAGDAYTQSPLTTDYGAAELFLDAVDVDAVPVPGTNIGAAITRALESFESSQKGTKVLVIITDGENTDGTFDDAAAEAARKGVLIYTIGLGSPGGAPIPVYGASGQQVDFKRDKEGNVVVSKLDEPALEKLAAIGGGKYYRGTNTQDELDAIYKDVNALQKQEFGMKQFTDFEDRFQFFLAVGLVLLLADQLLTERKNLVISRWNPLRKEGSV